MAPAPMHPGTEKANQGTRADRRTRPNRPVVATSVSAWPAKDWPRTTVKTPTIADTMALTRAHDEGDVHRG